VFLSAWVLSAAAFGQSQAAAEQAPPAQTPNAPAQDQPKKPEWLLVPIPISSPVIGSGLEWAVARVFPLDKQDKNLPASFVGVGGLFTNNGSRAIGAAGKLYFKQDKYRLLAATGTATINADIYGVGLAAGDRGLFLPLTAKGTGIIGEFLFQLRKGIYLGPRVQYRSLTISINQEEAEIPNIDDPPPGFEDIVGELRQDLSRQKTLPIGPRFQWDTRDNTFYPRRGFFLDSGIDFFSKAIGSDFTYQYYKIGFNKYASVGKNQVIAVRGMGCAAAGEHVPIYDLCLFGASNDLRGYAAGRYQDRRMFATQAEYRLTIPAPGILGRFGIVAFGGFGGVARKFSDMNFDELLPAGGAGIRFRLTKTYPINFRVDYGIGRVGHTFTVGVAEAF
jgi:hypothetical protein